MHAHRETKKKVGRDGLGLAVEDIAWSGGWKWVGEVRDKTDLNVST